MALNLDKLKKGLKDASVTTGIPDAANNYAKIFVDYYSDGVAGDAAPTLLQPALAALFLKTMNSQQFLQTLGTTLQAWFLTAAWSSSAFTGAPGTTVAVGPNLDAQMTALINTTLKSDGSADTLSEIAQDVHTWSGTIVVTLTNNQSGVTSPVPII